MGPSRILLASVVASCAALTACIPAAPPPAPPVAVAPAPAPPAPTTTAPPPIDGSGITGACAAGTSPNSVPDGGSAQVPAGASLDPHEAADQARAAAAAAIADPSLAGEAGDVPVVVTSVDADGRPTVTTLDTTGPADAAGDAAAVTEGVIAEGGDVLAVEPDPLVTVSDPTAADDAPASDPTALVAATDPGRPSQWAFNTIAFESAWDTTTGDGTCVAVLDTGIATAHPEFAGRIGGTYDLSGQGVEDAYGHGTHVAGIVAANANNGVGVAGAAPSATLLAVKVLSNSGWGQSSWVAQGITWAVDHGAEVINMSLGSACPESSSGACNSYAMQTAVAYAQSHDVVVVAAAGNDGDPYNNPEYNYWNWPAAQTWPIAVASIDQASARSSFSTQASYVDVTAPGSGIYSTYPTNLYSPTPGYRSMSGTSMATPYVAAMVALLRSAHPTETATQIRARVTGTVTDLGATGWDSSFGLGLINPVAALAG